MDLIITSAPLFLSSLALIFLLGLQQQNVTAQWHGYSFLTSFGIAGAQIFFIKSTVSTDLWVGVLAMGLGSAIGASASIVVHNFLRRRKSVIGKIINY